MCHAENWKKTLQMFKKTKPLTSDNDVAVEADVVDVADVAVVADVVDVADVADLADFVAVADVADVTDVVECVWKNLQNDVIKLILSFYGKFCVKLNYVTLEPATAKPSKMIFSCLF